MSSSRDLKRVRQWFSEGTLVDPSGPGPDFVDFARALYSLTGAPGLRLRPEALALASTIGKADHYVLVLIDGLGKNLLPLCPKDGFLQSHVVREIRSIYLSTTASALTTLATGEYPATHAVTGWWVYLSKQGISTTILPFVERFTKKPLTELGVNLDEVFITPSILPRLVYSPLTINRDLFTDTVYTRYSCAGTPVKGYKEPAEAFTLAIERVATAYQPTFTFIYLPHVDSEAHTKGIDAPEVASLLAKFDSLLGEFNAEKGPDTRLVVTGDHGHVNCLNQLFIDEDSELMDCLECPPTGEPSVPFFHVKGGKIRAFRKTFESIYGDYFALLTTSEVEELRLLGPEKLSPLTKARLGTFIGVEQRPTTLNFRPKDGKVPLNRGIHAGLTPDEMTVPLILA